jgi:putative endonuclease
MAWFLYLLECVDGSVYTGIAVDVHKRYAQHASGKGARYTRARPPRRLLAAQAFPDRSAASKAEYAVKQLKPAEKRALCARLGPPPALKPTAKKKRPAERPRGLKAPAPKPRKAARRSPPRRRKNAAARGSRKAPVSP